MEIFKKLNNIDFMRFRKAASGTAVALTCLAIVLLCSLGLKYSLEFTGGKQIDLRLNKEVSLSEINNLMHNHRLDGIRVQHYGSLRDLSVRLPNASNNYVENLQDKLLEVIATKYAPVEILRSEMIGSQVGQKLSEQGGVAILVAIIATIIYIALRFELRLAISAALALCHDALVILGIFVIFGLEFDLSALAAILAIVGYSLNDTIVVFDRLRENLQITPNQDILTVMNVSINQTLSRTLITSLLTLLVVTSLLLLGGKSLFAFSLVLFLGIIIGTYSSIFVAGSMAVLLGFSKKDMVATNNNNCINLP